MTSLLIVDDEPVNLGVLSDYLAGYGFRILIARSGEVALKRAKLFQPDIILLDILLPGIDGFEVCRRLKADKDTADIPILFMTALTSVEDKVKGLDLGAVDYISKPLQRKEVLSRVTTHLQIRNLTKNLQDANRELEMHRDQLEELVEERTAALSRANEQLKQEIVERKRAEAEIVRLATVIEQAAVTVVITDLEGNIIYANPDFERSTGYTVAEALGQNPRILKSDRQGVPFYQELWGAITADHTWNGIFINKRKDGELYHEEATIFPIKNVTGKIVNYAAVKRDVTDRVQAEEALLEKTVYLDNILRSATEYAIATTDLEFRITYYNLLAEQFFGYTADEVIGKTVQEMHTKENVAPRRFERAIENVRAHGEYRYLVAQKGDAGTRYLESRVSGIYDNPDGELLGFALFSRDITKHKQAEEEIRRRNRELTLLNQVIAASVAEQEPEVILEIVCRELVQTFNAPIAIAVLLNEEKTAARIAAQYPLQESLSVLNKVIPLEGFSAAQDILTYRKPKIINDALNIPHLAPIHNIIRRVDIASLLIQPLVIAEEVIGVLILTAAEVGQFSTERIELTWSVADQVAGALARSRLDKERQRFSAAIEQSAESVIITAADKIIIYVNPAFERLSGYSRAEAVGQNPDHLLDSGKQEAAFLQEMWATVEAGQVWRGRIINKNKTGGFYTEDATITPLRNEQGDIVNYVSVQRDVTRELQLEEHIHQAQKMEAIGRLAGGVAHDFNNILTAIIGYASLSLKLLPPDHPVRDDLQGIQKSARRAADLTRQLLTFARRQVIDPQVLNPNEPILNLDKMLRRLIGEDIELVTLLAPNLGRIKADPGQIEQVLVNLVVNARDAMPAGGKLTIETANATLGEDYARQHAEVKPGDYVMLAVSDTGTGMSEEVQARIFEPFFTTKAIGKGTGLGLATCYGIVKQSGGHIWVYSEVGQGTSIKVYLPLAEAEADAPPEYEEAELPGGTETILLAEDEASVRNLTARALRRLGYTVLEAANGEEALYLAREHSDQEIQLLFTDVVMPQMGGIVLAEQLRAMRPGIKVLYTSGYTDNAIVHHGVLDAGIAFLQKPFSPELLAAKVREVLGK